MINTGFLFSYPVFYFTLQLQAECIVVGVFCGQHFYFKNILDFNPVFLHRVFYLNITVIFAMQPRPYRPV